MLHNNPGTTHFQPQLALEAQKGVRVDVSESLSWVEDRSGNVEDVREGQTGKGFTKSMGNKKPLPNVTDQ